MEFQEVSTQYDKISEVYVQGHTGTYAGRTWAEVQIYKYTGPLDNKIVIDGGCGDGADTFSFLNKGAKEVLAFDPSEAMLTCVKNHHEKIQYKIGTFESIPFGNESADWVIGFFALHYVFELDIAYAEMVRVLKPGGKIAMVCTHPSHGTSRKSLPTKGQEVCEFQIFNGTLTVRQPTHTFAEYFSPYFLHKRIYSFSSSHIAEYISLILFSPIIRQ